MNAKIVGIDLSGPRNFSDTCLVCFEEDGDELRLLEVQEGADDHRILEAVSALGMSDPIIVGIDAPLSYNSSGGDRPSDATLRRFLREQGGRAGVMPPTMIRMVYLTLRGLQITRLLESLKPAHDLRIVETHPGACMLLRGADTTYVRSFKAEPSIREHLLSWLETKGLRGISREHASDHYVAACAAALGAWQWNAGKCMWCFPADPPHHPYDFAC